MPGPQWRGWPGEQVNPRPTATLMYEHRQTGVRHELHVDGRDSQRLDHNIVQAIGNIRDAGHRMVRTNLQSADGKEYVYEYDADGKVTHLWVDGDTTP